MRRRLIVVAGVIAGMGVLAAGATAAAHVAWPAPSMTSSTGALLHISLPKIGGKVESVRVLTTVADDVPVQVRHGDVWPLRKLPQGAQLVVQVTVRRPGWVAWLAGSTATRTFTVTTPSVHVQTRLLHVGRGDAVAIRLDTAAAVASIDGVVRRDAGTVLPIHTTESAGTVAVSAAPRAWELPSTPVRVSWFPLGVSRAIVTSPAPGTKLVPTQRLTLSFSSPILHDLPQVKSNSSGRWLVIDDHSIAFEPTGAGFPLGGSARIVLPRALRAVVPTTGRIAGTLTWPVVTGSTLRLQQVLGQLGYLPLRWHAAGAAPQRTLEAQVQAAVAPPAGTFAWRWKQVPATLRTLWTKPGTTNLITRAALMRFQDAHGLPSDGIADAATWRALMNDAVAGRLNTTGYAYVVVQESMPETLTLWHNGKLVLRTPGNTGIPAAPTATGTYPVFWHISVGTMSGTNPDGSHYDDPGVRWISYFNGGDAIHAFYRASYGSPQSLGCVELPYSAAEQVWPYTPVGTLVTVAS